MVRGIQLLLTILAPVAVFAAMIVADRTFEAPGRGTNYVLRIELPDLAEKIGLPPVEGPQDASRPLVVIDAGHGGHDPGAGQGAIREKNLTLVLAWALRDELLSRGGIRVALTRSDDRYLALPERSGIARRLGADLFLSIHADSVAGSDASGGSLYTLSERGSDEIAVRMAERENLVDRINGVQMKDKSDAVNAILVDLSQREVEARSKEFARLLVREGRGRIRFRDAPLQSAAFAVLKSPDVPSVLFESGYISNIDDATRLLSEEGREAFAGATADAIRVYFARQSSL